MPVTMIAPTTTAPTLEKRSSMLSVDASASGARQSRSNMRANITSAAIHSDAATR